MDDEARLRVVLDTNVLLVSISSRSKYHWIFERLLASDYDLVISNEILSEYTEILSDKLSPEVAQNVVRTLLLLPNVYRIDPLYRWSLIHVDPDDNKFVESQSRGDGPARRSQRPWTQFRPLNGARNARVRSFCR